MPGTDLQKDKALLKQLRTGSSDALRPIYEKYKPAMLAFALAMCPDKTAAEDVLHDVFVSFAKLAGSLKLKTSLKSYLLTSIANRIRNTRKSAGAHVVTLGDCDPADVRAMNAPELPAETESFRKLREALASLPDAQREVMILHHLEGLKFRVIARAKGASINTIHSRYRYGLRKMRDLLAEGNENA